MRALSWKQPFGTAMLYGKIETRTWDTKYRGKVLMCTSKRVYSYEDLAEISGFYLYHEMMAKTRDDLSAELLGYAIAIGHLVDTRPMRPEDEERCFVKFRRDLFCHIYENVQGIIPIPWKGSQGWKTVDKELIYTIT